MGEWECKVHDWVEVDPGSPRGYDGFRFCRICDREEYPSGAVREGWQNFRPTV